MKVAVGVAVGVCVAVGVAVAVAVGVGVGLGVEVATTMYFESLAMPLVKTVTRAGPKGNSLTGRERKRVSDQPPTRSTRTKTTSLLPRLRNCTIG